MPTINNPFDLPMRKLPKQLQQAIKKLPRMLGAETVKFAKENWQKQGYQGNAFTPWLPRRSGNNRRGILLNTGRLRRSVRVVRVTADSVVIGTDVPYAAVHNEGFSGSVRVKAHTRNKYGKTKVGTGIYSVKSRNERKRTVTSVTGSSTVKAHTRYIKIPKRQFLGDSPVLIQRLRRIVAAEIMKALKY